MLKISKDKNLLEINVISDFLKTSYWAGDRTLQEIKETIKNCECYGVYFNNEQIGFARVLSDKIVFAYLMDFFIIKDHRKNGYSKLLLDKIINDPELKNVKKWMLKTSDAHQLYEKYGFNVVQDPENWMILNK